MIEIEVNGKKISANEGDMLIKATDEAGIEIPRFCYHKKLSISANCRMCMVEVDWEGSNRPSNIAPACATPVAKGMQIRTKSEKALDAQKGTMEFLLINHPLDCPICDQGGECELQDVSVAYGNDVSRFTEEKRIVIDKNIGPLIATDMTRCIHCTRCSRFSAEIAGLPEIGSIGRGDRLKISTYIEKSLESELSGNMIDICPVGALTAKPSRYTARAWEMLQHKTIAPHDSIGSNLYIHSFKGNIVRTVPRENEAVNECWLSDRDRFSYQGLQANDRLLNPQIKHNGRWQEVSWEKILKEVAEIIKNTEADKIGVIASPNSTIEELYLLQRLMRGIGVNNIDYRLRQTDFSDQDNDPIQPVIGVKLAELEQQDAILLIGSNVRKAQPLINHRIRKAAIRKEKPAKIMAVNPYKIAFNYEVSPQCVATPNDIVSILANIAQVSGDVPDELKIPTLENIDQDSQTIIDHLKSTDKGLILLGDLSVNHPSYGLIRAYASIIAKNTGTKLGYLPEASNTVGASIAGVLPHRTEAGLPTAKKGKNLTEMLDERLDTYILFNVDPAFDMAEIQKSTLAFNQANNVIALTSFASNHLRQKADILLPISLFTETSGTFVNAEGKWQSFKGIMPPASRNIRPGWKILRVLGSDFLHVAGFDYVNSLDIREEVRWSLEDSPDEPISDSFNHLKENRIEGLQRIGEMHHYRNDSIVRRATTLQKMISDKENGASLHPTEIKRLGLVEGKKVLIKQQGTTSVMPVFADECIPKNCILIHTGTSGGAMLASTFGSVEIKRT